MPLVAMRKLTETWREAVARRGREVARETECLQDFDQSVEGGEAEAAAAFGSLARFEALLTTAEGPAPGRREEI